MHDALSKVLRSYFLKLKALSSPLVFFVYMCLLKEQGCYVIISIPVI